MFSPTGFIRWIPWKWPAPKAEGSPYRDHPYPERTQTDPDVVAGICTIPAGHYLDVPFRLGREGDVDVFVSGSNRHGAEIVTNGQYEKMIARETYISWDVDSGEECRFEPTLEEQNDLPFHLVAWNDCDEPMAFEYELG